MKTAFAQGFALVDFTGFAGSWAFEGKNVTHTLIRDSLGFQGRSRLYSTLLCCNGSAGIRQYRGSYNTNNLPHFVYGMNKTHTDIIVAAHGWSHPGWCDDFYPEDLPEDWQLSFYSNEFRAVVVPASAWSIEDPLEIERWAEDTSEDFVFYLEVVGLQTDWVRLAEAVKPLGEQLGGILLRPVEVDADLAMIASCLDAAVTVAPVCVLLPEKMELSEIGRSLLKQQNVSLCWNVGEGNPTWTQGGFAVARVASTITGAMNYTPRQWRETIEQCLRCTIEDGRKRRVLLMVDQESPDIDSLRAAVMIGDMLVIPDID